MKDTINIGDTKEMLCEMLAIPSVSGDEGALYCPETSRCRG